MAAETDSRIGGALRVAVVSCQGPPLDTEAARRLVELAGALLDAGHTVLAAVPTPASLTDPRARALADVPALPPGCRVLATPFRPEQWNPVMNTWPNSRRTNGKLWSATRQRALAQLTSDTDYADWFADAVQTLWSAHGEAPIDVVVAVGGPATAVRVAREFAEASGAAAIADNATPGSAGAVPRGGQELAAWARHLGVGSSS